MPSARLVVALTLGCGVVTLSSAVVAGTARPPAATTQRAVISAQAYKQTDPAATDPQAVRALSASMVSATFTNTPALKAFAELSKQTGYRIEPYDNGQTRYGNVTATINNQPFWAAVREICTRANVNLYYYGGDTDNDLIPLLPSNYGNEGMIKAAASIQGPFMTVVSSLQRVNTVNLADPDRTGRSIHIQVYTFAEPKSVPVQYAYEPTVDEAVDDNGNAMTPEPRDPQHRNMQSGRGVSWHGYFQLPYPASNPGKRIARIRGHIDAIIQLGSEPMEIDNPLKASETSKTVGGKKVTFKRMTSQENGRYEVELVLSRGENEDAGTFQQNAFNTTPSLKLIDDKDGRYQMWPGGGRGGQDEVVRQFTFNRRGNSPAAEPTKLVIEIPSATKEIEIPFELVDLPLP